ncbi:transporter substrate-binding domain-containing protein [Pararobbsia alpina]|uniref:Aliphatic amidase expression-regulating protein n=1 Tax=Pararobbsia alpina TaxID=621374 RepID=A0A6S7BJV8_9BURK|nr:transporter substrate-binding domain-containing protein [Pararobbsia alpina]CAB3802218.1 Aliphatic amidase expression-regulating protein [Pararobbsia alpina]
MAHTDPVKVGVLYSETGATSSIESSQLFGTLFAIELINEAGGINGREIVPVRYDPGSERAVYAALAERLITSDNVKVIFGCYMSNTRKAVIPIVERWNRLLFYSTLYEGFEYSDHVIYTGAAPNQNSVQLAEFMTSTFGPRVYLVGSNYIYPYESNRIMADLVSQQSGGEKTGERYVPLDASERDFAEILADIRNVRPDFIFSTVVGNATQNFYRAYARAGFDPAKLPIGSLTTTEVEIAQMGADIAAGHFTSAPYFQSIDNPVNHACLTRFRDRFGDCAAPNACWEAAFFQVHLFANAMRASGSDDIDALMPHLLGASFQAPQGRVRIEPSNHHTYLNPRIGRANEAGQFTIVRETRDVVYPDPYLVTHALGDWALRMSPVES